MGHIVMARYGALLAAGVCSLIVAAALVAAFRDTTAQRALAAPVGAGPTNDFFSAPIVVQSTDLPFTPVQQTAGATLEQGETAPCGPIGATVWYTFQPQTTGTFEISTAGSDFDTIVAVYTLGGGFLPSPPGANLVPVACNDDSGAATSLVTFPLQQYGSYFIQVGGKNGAAGNLALRFTCNPACPPPNDNSTAAQYVSVDSYNPASTTRADTRAATSQAGEPSPCGNIGKTVWYQFYAQQDVSIIADTASSSFDTVLAAYTYGANFPASPPGGFTPLVCNDNAIGAQSKIALHVKQGNAYFLQAGGSKAASGDLVLNLRCDPLCPPFNDTIAFSSGLQPPYDDHITTLGATLESGEPRPCGSIGATVWYIVYVPGAVNVSVDTSGSAFDTVVAAYDAPYGPADFGALNRIACNDNAATPQGLTFAASNDRQFFVQVGGHDGASGELAIRIDCDPSPCPPQNDGAGNAQYFDSTYLPYGFGEDTRGATIETGEQLDCGAMAHTVWFAVHATTATRIDFNTAGSDFDTAVAVYDVPPFFSPPGGAAPRTQCAVSAGGVRADAEFDVAADSTTYIQVGAQGGGAGGMLSFVASCVPVCPPPNDNSPSAQSIYGSPFELNVDTRAATLEPGEPRPCGDIGATVWFHIRSATASRVRISTEGTQFASAVAAYEPRSISPQGGADEIGCNDSTSGAVFEFAIAADHDYLIQAGGVGGAAGQLAFHFACLSDCALNAGGPAVGGGGVIVGPNTGGTISLPDTGSGGYLPGARTH